MEERENQEAAVAVEEVTPKKVTTTTTTKTWLTIVNQWSKNVFLQTTLPKKGSDEGNFLRSTFDWVIAFISYEVFGGWYTFFVPTPILLGALIAQGFSKTNFFSWYLKK